MTARPSPWPKVTNQLLPHNLFNIAEKYPQITYAEFPRNPLNISEGYRAITFVEVANAVHAVAWWIEQNVGKLEDVDKIGKETLVYIGPNDIRYVVLCLGSIMCGYKMLFPSPRYGAQALVKLIESVDAKVMLMPESNVPVVDEVLKIKEMKALKVPAVDWLLSTVTERYPYTKEFEQYKHEPFVCLHTSGTTGFPKPIVWTHDWANSAVQTMYLDPPPGYEIQEQPLYGLRNCKKMRAFFQFPPFHASGMFGMIFLPLQLGVVPVYSPLFTTPAEGVQGALAALDVLAARDAEDEDIVVDTVMIGPPCAEHLGKHPEDVLSLSKRASHIGWGGGSVSRAATNAVTATMKVMNIMASTEQGMWPCVLPIGAPPKDDSAGYAAPHPAFNLRFDPVSKSTDDTVLYEAVITRNDGVEWKGHIQPIFKFFTEAKERRTGDLYAQHPQDASLWLHHGRADDMLTFITNENFFPTVAEERVASHAGVVEVMMVGTRRPKAALILRLEPGVKLEDVWKVTEEVNQDSPTYARVEKHMVLVTKEPFLKTPKGTVQKRAMLDLYGKELDDLYEKVGNVALYV
ncbi:hypothetical protein TUN199_06351 [Pyrenophora tritici-repentis]|nr:NRPS-like enzyme [Pyrenophora tritici-repentis]KAI0612899.1 NRPS-like enzyme [Pyrenophora tritici-repentis]KAI0621670.1 hypothetical protein TUN199_06351 [Pyrenophora tritici-repentis]